MISRRSLVQSLLPAAAALALPPRRPILAYVGSYSSPQGPEGSHGNGQGIYLFEMNPETGRSRQRDGLSQRREPFVAGIRPLRNAPLLRQRDGRWLRQRVLHRPRERPLTLLNTVSSEGAGPAHLSVHPSGKYVLVANYAGGTVAVLPILSRGDSGRATDVKHDQGPVGPRTCRQRPARQLRHQRARPPHAHMIQADPAGRFVFSTDLGLDRILIWKFDAEPASSRRTIRRAVSLPPGDGPRHFAFHPNGRWFYSLQEEGSTLVIFDYDAAPAG